MKWWQVTLVILGSVGITALGIDAADTMTGSRSTLLSSVINRQDAGCPEGMISVTTVEQVSCVDMYEASPGADCPERVPTNLISSIRNTDASKCVAVSERDAIPWRFITRDQAMQACAKGGKRLPTSKEWYALSLGMSGVHQSCNVNTKDVSRTGSYGSCVTPRGVYDMVGNVWEWVSDDVIEGKYRERELPEKGFVSQVDDGGMATRVADEEQELFGSDYFWSQKIGAFGIVRGGYFDSGTDAGVYAVHADTVPTSASAGIGFRCVQ